MKGKLIVFEGIDGSGKTTICRLLLNYFKKQKINYAHYSFPRYDSPWGKMVRRYLGGEFGSVGAVDPYIASVLYAGDRFDASRNIRADLDKGKIVVCDRYVASNVAHQAAKLITHHSRQRRGSPEAASLITFINWIEEFEYANNKIPREGLVILLSVAPAISQRLMNKKKKDIHEKDKDYLKDVWRVFEDLAKSKSNWGKVDCVRGGKLRKPEDIHKEVLQILKERHIL